MSEAAPPSFGLFTRTEVKEKVVNASRTLAYSPERLHQLGLKGVQRMNPKAERPNMEPSGPKRAKVYVLSFHPGVDEDATGKPLVGNSGRYLFKRLPEDGRAAFRLNYVCRTLPPPGKDGKPRKPTPTEVECFRPSVVEDVERCKPRVIVGLGAEPMKWVMGEQFKVEIGVCRGRRFPVKIGSHVCWYYPVHHPSFVVQRLDDDEAGKARKPDEPAGRDLDAAFKRDLVRAFEDAERGDDAPEVVDADPETFLKRVEAVDGHGGERDCRRVERWLAEASKLKVTTADLETNRLRPYEKGAKVLTFSVGTWDKAMAVALDHPQAGWKPEHRKRVLKAFESYLRSKTAKQWHNVQFDLEWCVFLFGPSILRAGGLWHCTMHMAYCLDERKGGHGLNFLCAQRFGLQVKRLSKGRKVEQGDGLTALFTATADDEIDRNLLEQTKLSDVLGYNGLDVLITDRLGAVQRKELRAEGLYAFYEQFQVRRAPTLVQAQVAGMVVNDDAVAEFTKKLTHDEKTALAKIKALDVVKRYEKRYGPFNPGSPQILIKFFQDVAGIKDFKSSKEAVLNDIKERGGEVGALAGYVLDYRKPGKMLSTYVSALDRKTENSMLFPDGKIHPTFNACRTDTGRLSAERPPVQQWPKRKNAWLRAVIGCPPGHVMLSCDEGQLEYRVIGLNSRDPVLVDSMFTGFDVHGYWAERIASKYDKTFKARGGDMKAFRGDVKNQWVFPLCFGSSPKSCARNLQMPEDVAFKLADEFWDQLKGVKAWQKKVVAFYEKHFYVPCLSGRRRRGPMSYNMQINSSVQGYASDLVIDAMNRLAEMAVELDKPYLAPVLNIHDDLTFYVPKRKVEEALEYIVPAMLTFEYEACKGIPFLVEAAVGNDWGNQEAVGKFDGYKLGITKREN